MIDEIVNRINRQKISKGRSDIRHVKNWNTLEDELYMAPQLSIIPHKCKKILCHTYWYGEFGRKQAFSVKSFLATQNLDKVELWLWLDEENCYNNYESNPYIVELLPFIKVKKYNPKINLVNTCFEKNIWFFIQKKMLSYRADGFRLWALITFGGFYFDLDVMFCRELTDLFYGPEFVYAWEFQPYANNAILFLRKNSYISEYIRKKVNRRFTTQPWIIFNYKDKIMRNMLVYPAIYFDPLWCLDLQKCSCDLPIDKFVKFFKEFDDNFVCKVTTYQDWFKGIYAYHWHNCWKIEEKDNSYFGIFEKEFTTIIENKKKSLYCSD